jgi:type VI secretion system protein
MQYSGSLFERLTGFHLQKQGLSDEEKLYRSVANNLSNILSTNAGSAETVKDYGKPDLNNINLSQKESFDFIEKNIEKCIKKYEPRLFSTHTAIVKESLQMNAMNILIQGFLNINGTKKRIGFKADLTSSGKVRVVKNDY